MARAPSGGPGVETRRFAAKTRTWRLGYASPVPTFFSRDRDTASFFPAIGSPAITSHDSLSLVRARFFYCIYTILSGRIYRYCHESNQISTFRLSRDSPEFLCFVVLTIAVAPKGISLVDFHILFTKSPALHFNSAPGMTITHSERTWKPL